MQKKYMHASPSSLKCSSTDELGSSSGETSVRSIAAASPPHHALQLRAAAGEAGEAAHGGGGASYTTSYEAAPHGVVASPHAAESAASSSAGAGAGASAPAAAGADAAPARGVLLRLYGVVEHHGSFEGGHYVAFLRLDGGWFRMSDSLVTQVDEASVLRAQAFLLFYDRLDGNMYFG